MVKILEGFGLDLLAGMSMAGAALAAFDGNHLTAVFAGILALVFVLLSLAEVGIVKMINVPCIGCFVGAAILFALAAASLLMGRISINPAYSMLSIILAAGLIFLGIWQLKVRQNNA
jgi:FtsH-binding integral membrane protein